MRTLRLFMALAASVLFMGVTTSCGDDDDNNPNGGKLLLSSFGNEESMYSFTYDSQNRITILSNKIAGEDEYTKSFVYGADGKISSMIAKGPSSETTYSITHTTDTIYQMNGSNVVVKLAVNGKGQVTKKIKGSDTTTYEYDSAGNVTKSTQSYGSTITITYTYDTKNGPLINANIPSWLMVSESTFELFWYMNNVAIRIYKYENPNDPQYNYTVTSTITYQYNESGQPTQMSDEYYNDQFDERGVEVYTYTYIQAN